AGPNEPDREVIAMTIRTTKGATAAATMPAIPSPRSAGGDRAPLNTAVYADLARARRGITEAAAAATAEERYATAHVAALRVAAAVVAARARPTTGRSRRQRNVWVLLTKAAPELAEWASFFSAGAPKRAAAEAGLPGAVTLREADDLLRDVGRFLGVAERLL